jgi:parvulin-like peptidyl-prolyl isomerase
MTLAMRFGVLAALPLVFILTSCATKGLDSAPAMRAEIASLPSTAATVDGKSISTSAVISQAFVDNGSAALGQLIDYEILDQAAAAQHIVVTAAEVDARMRQSMGRAGAKAFDQQLSHRHIPISQVEDKLRHEIILEKLSATQLPGPDLMLHVRTILIATRPTQRGVDINKPHSDAEALAIITKIQAQLRAGKKFEDLARQYSEDPVSRSFGGDIGIIDIHDDPFSTGAHEIGGPLWNAAQGLKDGQIALNPVKSYLGYHLVQVVSWSTSPLPSDAAEYAANVKQMNGFMMKRLMQGTMARLRDSAKIDETLFNSGSSG